jgi:tetratricopeptide (TPR) repeat protein
LENLSLILKNEGKTHAALERLDEAIQVLPRSGCCTLRVNNQLHRGVCFVRLGQVQSARACLLEAQASAHRAGQRALVNAIHSNLGHIYRMEGNYAPAREFYEETLRAARAAGLSRQQALALEFLAETCVEDGRAVEALALLDEALAIATPLADCGDLVMEILRRRGAAKLAIGQRVEGLEDLRRAIELCRARGEVRERLLAERAYHLAAEAPIDEISARLEALLPNLQRIGDRFEYARTVCSLLEDGRFDTARKPWLAEAVTTATHYFSSMGLRLWKDRLQRVAGHVVHIRSESSSPTTARLRSSSQTRSQLFT